MNTLGVTISICSSLLAWSVAVHAAPATDALPADSLHRIEGEFQDHRGRATSLAEASGPTTLLAMFYATCPMACPMLIADIKRVVGALTPEERARVTVVLVSLDPSRDTVERLEKVYQERALDGERWRLLRADPSSTRVLAAALGVRFRSNDDGSIDHTSKIVLLDARGRSRGQREAIGAEVEDFVTAIRRQLRDPG